MTSVRRFPAARRAVSRHTLIVTTGLVLAAFSLRPALASVGPLLDELRGGLGLTGATAGLLTALPPAAFAVAGSAAPALTRRFGPDSTLLVGMGVLALGLLARALAGNAALFLLCSAVAIGGIGVSNVVMPVAVRHYFPDRIGTMTGLYSTALTCGAALAAAVSVPLADRVGHTWRTGLGFWAVPAALAVLAWLPGRAARRRIGVGDGARPVVAAATSRFRPDAGVWALTVFFGLQAAAAYIVLGWLPQILRDAGVSADTAGLLLALTPAVGIPFAFLMPALAARTGQQSVLAAAVSALGLFGYAGLWLAPTGAPWLWAVLLGISQSAFPLALAMIGLRGTSGPTGAARLSAFVQGIGYLISMPGPLLVGLLNERTGGWGWPLAFMAALLVPQSVCGYLAGRHRHR